MNNNEKSVLPADFDGIFRFTNFTKQEFKAKWDNVEYTFPPENRSPMIIAGATPEQVQSIRKKFARELAIREWYKSPKFEAMNAHIPGGTPALYTDSDLAPYIQRCLEPLPLAQAIVQILPKVDMESKLAKDRRGRPVTKILDKDDSLMAEASAHIE